ncbi:lanthionine synthetase C family protein [Streptomyces sp. NPDC005438]|uniref:lanthionine synthetase C family protein n=1 Tax=Streptomyces sp. NPDC005438 TaxID=3156880 RepID=UPI0033BAF231
MSPAPAPTPTRVRAAEVAEWIADRLADPERVVAATVAGGTHAQVHESRSPVWEDGSLNRGYPALALLYAELGHPEGGSGNTEAHRRTAHRYLTLTAEATRTVPPQGTFVGIGALASAVRVAASRDGEYASLLRSTDARMADHARQLAALHHSTRQAGLPTYPAVVDVLSGLSGVGRYLLHRHTRQPEPERDEALRECLAALTALNGTLRVNGVEVPGWWFGATQRTRVGEEFDDGQANFGLAHGVPGPLGLLSLAWEHGVRVPGQPEAIQAMATWLLDRRERDQAGPYWTPFIPLRYHADWNADRNADRNAHPPPLPARPSWCYGAVGTARALGMAGRALDRPEWTRAGLEAVRAMLARPMEGWAIHDHALCHGWSGLLHTLGRLEWEHPEAELGPAVDQMAERLLEGFDPDAPFGYRYYQPAADLHLDLPGLLDGAAGIALALRAYAHRRPPASEWDTLLLLG